MRLRFFALGNSLITVQQWPLEIRTESPFHRPRISTDDCTRTTPWIMATPMPPPPPPIKGKTEDDYSAPGGVESKRAHNTPIELDVTFCLDCTSKSNGWTSRVHLTLFRCVHLYLTPFLSQTSQYDMRPSPVRVTRRSFARCRYCTRKEVSRSKAAFLAEIII